MEIEDQIYFAALHAFRFHYAGEDLLKYMLRAKWGMLSCYQGGDQLCG